MRGAVALVLAASACGRGAAPAAEVSNRGASRVDAAACGDGDELEALLDEDDRPDLVRLAPSAQAVRCLEIVASSAPRLVCSDTVTPRLPQVETSDAAPEEVGVATCDPMGAHVTAFSHDRMAVMLGEAAPTRTGLRLSGGDATAAIVWRRGQWTWIELGF